MSKNNGGPAFPCQELGTQHATEQMDHGMSLRDWFAGQALAGICSHNDTWGLPTKNHIAFTAYELADAMIAECNESRED